MKGVFTITFDDGSRSQLERGYPVLESLGVPGVLFFVTGRAGRRFAGERLLRAAELRELASAGWEIGSHTVSHPRLAKDGETRLSPEALTSELADSRRWLRDLGFPARSFAYPYGRYNAEVERAAARFYRHIRTTADGLNRISGRNARLGSYNLCDRKVARWKRAIDTAAETGQWAIGVVHHVAATTDEIPPDDEANWIGSEHLAECVEYALGAGLAGHTFEEVHTI